MTKMTSNGLKMTLKLSQKQQKKNIKLLNLHQNWKNWNFWQNSFMSLKLYLTHCGVIFSPVFEIIWGHFGSFHAILRLFKEDKTWSMHSSSKYLMNIHVQNVMIVMIKNFLWLQKILQKSFTKWNIWVILGFKNGEERRQMLSLTLRKKRKKNTWRNPQICTEAVICLFS